VVRTTAGAGAVALTPAWIGDAGYRAAAVRTAAVQTTRTVARTSRTAAEDGAAARMAWISDVGVVQAWMEAAGATFERGQP